MNGSLDISDLSIEEHDVSVSLGDAKIHKLVRDYKNKLKKLPVFKQKDEVEDFDFSELR